MREKTSYDFYLYELIFLLDERENKNIINKNKLYYELKLGIRVFDSAS